MTQYSISIDEFLKLGLEGYTLIPVYKEVLADLETPVSAYLKICLLYTSDAADE